MAVASDLLLELGLRGEALGALVEARRLAMFLAREADDHGAGYCRPSARLCYQTLRL